MSESVALAIVAGVVTTVGALITAVVTVLVVKIRRDVNAVKKVIAAFPAVFETEMKTTRAVLARRGPDDVSAGAVHTHQRSTTEQ